MRRSCSGLTFIDFDSRLTNMTAWIGLGRVGRGHDVPYGSVCAVKPSSSFMSSTRCTTIGEAFERGPGRGAADLHDVRLPPGVNGEPVFSAEATDVAAPPVNRPQVWVALGEGCSSGPDHVRRGAAVLRKPFGPDYTREW